MAEYIIDNSKPVNVFTKPMELPPRGVFQPNEKTTIGAIVHEQVNHIFRANSSVEIQYDRKTPLAMNYTTDVGGVAKSLSSANLPDSPVNNTVSIKSVLINTAIRNNQFNAATGSFTTPPSTIKVALCPDSQNTTYVGSDASVDPACTQSAPVVLGAETSGCVRPSVYTMPSIRTPFQRIFLDKYRPGKKDEMRVYGLDYGWVEVGTEVSHTYELFFDEGQIDSWCGDKCDTTITMRTNEQLVGATLDWMGNYNDDFVLTIDGVAHIQDDSDLGYSPVFPPSGTILRTGATFDIAYTIGEEYNQFDFGGQVIANTGVYCDSNGNAVTVQAIEDARAAIGTKYRSDYSSDWTMASYMSYERRDITKAWPARGVWANDASDTSFWGNYPVFWGKSNTPITRSYVENLINTHVPDTPSNDVVSWGLCGYDNFPSLLNVTGITDSSQNKKSFINLNATNEYCWVLLPVEDVVEPFGYISSGSYYTYYYRVKDDTTGGYVHMVTNPGATAWTTSGGYYQTQADDIVVSHGSRWSNKRYRFYYTTAPITTTNVFIYQYQTGGI